MSSTLSSSSSVRSMAEAILISKYRPCGRTSRFARTFGRWLVSYIPLGRNNVVEDRDGWRLAIQFYDEGNGG